MPGGAVDGQSVVGHQRTRRPRIPAVPGRNYMGHNYMGHHYMGHHYMGHNLCSARVRSCWALFLPAPMRAFQWRMPHAQQAHAYMFMASLLMART